jgi:ATP-binding cassette subfamily C (CFTR/MRP) protein 1
MSPWGKLISSRFSQDIGEIDNKLPLGMTVTLSSKPQHCVYLLSQILTGRPKAFLVSIAQAILVASATWYLAVCYPFLIAVFYFLQQGYLRTSRQLRFLDLEEKAPV